VLTAYSNKIKTHRNLKNLQVGPFYRNWFDLKKTTTQNMYFIGLYKKRFFATLRISTLKFASALTKIWISDRSNLQNRHIERQTDRRKDTDKRVYGNRLQPQWQ